MQFLGLCLLSYILMSCYIEIGHDKGWPKAAYMYSHFHKFVVPISSVLTHDDVATQQSYLRCGTLFLLFPDFVTFSKYVCKCLIISGCFCCLGRRAKSRVK